MSLLLWLYHNVLGNLVATAITSTVAYIKLRNQRERHHMEDNKQFDKLHKQLGESQ